jgi:hypothetical protein
MNAVVFVREAVRKVMGDDGSDDHYVDNDQWEVTPFV